MTAATAAAGRKAHVDTAAVRGQAAWRAGLGFGWVPQIVQLRRGDRGEMDKWTLWVSKKLPLYGATFFLFKGNHLL